MTGRTIHEVKEWRGGKMTRREIDDVPQPLTDEPEPIGDNRQFSVTPKIEPIPRDKWPSWAAVLGEVSRPSDKGVGDVVTRIIGPEGSYGFKEWMKKTLNRTCSGGCVANLNLMYPLP